MQMSEAEVAELNLVHCISWFTLKPSCTHPRRQFTLSSSLCLCALLERHKAAPELPIPQLSGR
jgi:hypothetical protein